MSNAERIGRKAQDCIDALEAIRQRATLAEQQARPPSRRPDYQPKAKGPTDPAGTTALEIVDALSRVDVSLADVKHILYAIAARLEDWAPARHWDNGIRRCGLEGCALQHYALGLCKKHYTYEKRQEARETADRTRDR